MMVKVARISSDGLDKQEWTFVVDCKFQMTRYERLERKSKRHKWKPFASWSRYSWYSSTIKAQNLVPLPADVVEEAKGLMRPALEKILDGGVAAESE